MTENNAFETARAWLRDTTLPVWVGIVLLILLVAVFAWQRIAVNGAEARLADERAAMTARFDADRAALFGQVRQLAGERADVMQRRYGMALAWAVRGEMIRNNLDQIDQFIAEMVRQPDTRLVLLAAPDGKVVLASDRQHLGAAAADLVAADALVQPDVGIRTEVGGERLLVVPVMGLNARLGTLLLRYREPDPLPGMQ